MSPRRPAFRSRTAAVARYAAVFLAGLALGLMMGASGCASLPKYRPHALETISPETAYARMNASFVIVLAETADGHAAQGSGTVIYDLAGHQLVLTAAHIFTEGKTTAFALVTMDTGLPARLLKLDRDADLALVEVLGRLDGVSVLPVAETDPAVYDTVFTEGNPSGAPNTVAPGVLSRVRHLRGQDRYQITGFCWPGCSGGPVVNTRGELIGVIEAVHMTSDQTVEDPSKDVLLPQICYATPLPTIKAFLKTAGVIL